MNVIALSRLRRDEAIFIINKITWKVASLPTAMTDEKMKLKKLYKHDNKKQIWRILPAEAGNVVVEERDSASKEVSFSCFNIQSKKIIFNDFQFDEKNWCGIESVYKDVIFFHMYGKPDMPNHKSIIAFDINSKKILWQNNSYVFATVYNDRVYCFVQRFDSKHYYSLDYMSGNLIEELGTDTTLVAQSKEKANEEFSRQNYLFPEYFNRNDDPSEVHKKHLNSVIGARVIKGDISYLLNGELLLYNFHEVSNTNLLNNIFTGFDLSKNKILLEEVLDKNLTNLMPESFFVKDDFLFLIVDKTKLLIYQIKN